MPRAPKKCATHECEARVTARTYCDEHKPMNWAGSPRTGTAEHKAWRLAVLNRDRWTCQLRGPRCEGRANEAHHVIAVAFGGAYTLDNGVAACGSCHQAETQKQAAAGRRLSNGG